MTLIIENANDELTKAIKAMAKIANAQVKLQNPKYTKLEKELINGITEIESKRKNGTKSYKNMQEYKKAMNV